MPAPVPDRPGISGIELAVLAEMAGLTALPPPARIGIGSERFHALEFDAGQTCGIVELLTSRIPEYTAYSSIHTVLIMAFLQRAGALPSFSGSDEG